MSRVLWIALLATVALQAQNSGVSTEWDTRKMLTDLVAKTQLLGPVLDKVEPQAWVEKGAPDTYVAQWKSARAETGYLVRAATELARQPERLPLALEAYFRMQSAEELLVSLGEGIRTYQSAPLADQLRAALTENANNREKLREYLVELANVREKECGVADREAQRCRAGLAGQKRSGATDRKEQRK